MEERGHREKLPDNEIDSLHDEELRTIKLDVLDENDKESLRKISTIMIIMNRLKHKCNRDGINKI